MINVELLGGPHCGQTMRVALHVPFLRIPVAGVNAQVPTFADPDVPLSSELLVATYERAGARGNVAVFRYVGQDVMR